MPNQTLDAAKAKMDKAFTYLHDEYAKLQTGRANAALVDGIMVESYGTQMPLRGVASVSIPESNQIVIQPWNRDQLVDIEKAIKSANIGLNPQNDGIVIRLILPPLTEERRRDIVKTVHKLAEEARISIRNARHEALSSLKSLEREKQISEDEMVGKESDLQKVVDDFNKRVEDAAKKKETDVMTV